ncbi:hypothetical protein Pan181_19730 [Aeoliella mucimassa]|uniref:Uncharacterized protein n=1 Tax=Aeoliella mucimassa TaxID=2527972 RepID=A0A518AM26_9BACT|nr:hypothetical protein Pan181_19730 [Aeoliella mucimassa]
MEADQSGTHTPEREEIRNQQKYRALPACNPVGAHRIDFTALYLVRVGFFRPILQEIFLTLGS